MIDIDYHIFDKITLKTINGKQKVFIISVLTLVSVITILFDIVINCGYPGGLEHGRVSGSNSYLYGDTVWYSCEHGYTLKGPNLLLDLSP